MSKSPREYIRHMLDEIEYILSQLQGRDFSAFNQDATLTRAFVRSLEIIGEAAKKLKSAHNHLNATSERPRFAGLPLAR